ncbi:SpoIIE family protein phosphatase [Streptomyces sp.]
MSASGPPKPAEPPEADRLRLALRQAVAALGGLGGMVHLYGPGGSRRLRLAASSGLPQELARRWEEIAEDAGDAEDTAAVRALREDAAVWLPIPRNGSGLPPRTGMASAPIRAGDGPLGALSVVTSGTGPPTPAQLGFLEGAARWISERLRLQQALDTVRVGAWDWNIRSGDIVWDDTMSQVLGIAPGDFDGRIETWRGLVHPEDLPAVVAQAEQALRKGGEYSVRHRVRRPDGTVGWVEARGRIIRGEDGEPARMVGRLWETTETRAAMDSVGRALRHMSDGFLAVDANWRILYVNVRAERLLGSSRELAGRTLWDIPAVRVPGFEERCRQASAQRIPAGLDIRSPADRRWYHMRLIPVPDGLTVYLTDVTEKRQLEAEHAAMERAAAERATHIGLLTTALAEALTVEDVVTAAAQRVLPLFGATGLIVQAIERGQVRAVGSVGYPRSFLDQLSDRPADNPLDRSLTDGVPRFFASPEEMDADFPGVGSFAALGGKRAWAFLPLLVSGRPVGGCVISFDRPRGLTGEERALLVALSGLIAQTLERARLYDAEHGRAQELQRGLLPRVLPSLPAVTTAARYLPASEGMLGGDWYDVIPLSADRVALVIGDVMGHGLSEAATMGRLRTAVHTLADLELPPDEVFSHLNDLVSDLGDDFYATCLYALYDPATGACTFVCAGHPPPAVVDPDGRVRLLDLAADPPLGAATPPFETTEVKLPEGSLLVLYTDGFVESARRDIDSGIAQLAGVLARGPDASPADDRTGEAGRLDRLCESLAAELLPAQEQTSDDAAVLIARIHALRPQDVTSWTLPNDPVAAGQARDHIRRQLADWQLDDLVMTTELLASELVGNVVRHAKGPVRLRLLRSRTLICEVSDGSLTTPRIRRARETDEGGRGLQLVAALSQRWGTRYTSDGKCIWTEQLLPEADVRITR